MMTAGFRRLTFTTHVASSVGWVGAVIVFLALAGIGLTSSDEPTVRGAYLVMAPAAWFVLVPLAHASLISGVALSLGTAWGLVRYYWVALKLLITVFATVILLIYMGTFRQMAGVAADPVVGLEVVRNASPLVHASLALSLLLAATMLGIYKPLGMTPYGMRKQEEQRLAWAPNRFAATTVDATAAGASPRGMYLLAGAVLVVLLLLLAFLHLAGGEFSH